MKKNYQKTIAKAMAVAMAASLVATVPADADAAKKVKLSKKTVKVAAKATTKVTLKNVKKNKIKSVKVKMSKKAKKIAKVSWKKKSVKVNVKGLKKGTAKATLKVTLKGVKKATNLKLTVKVSAKKATKPAATKAPAALAAAASKAPAASAAAASKAPVASAAASAAASATPSAAASATPSAAPSVEPTPEGSKPPAVTASPIVALTTDNVVTFGKETTGEYGQVTFNEDGTVNFKTDKPADETGAVTGSVFNNGCVFYLSPDKKKVSLEGYQYIKLTLKLSETSVNSEGKPMEVSMITFSGGEDPGNYWDKHDTWGTMVESRQNADGSTTYIYPVNDETFSAVKKATAVGFLIKATDYVGDYTGEEPYKPAEATVYGFSFSNTLEDEVEETAAPTAAPSSEPVVIETGDVETTTTETESSETAAPTEAPAANVVSSDVNYDVTIAAGTGQYSGYVAFNISDLLAKVPEGKIVTSVKIYGTSNSSALFANLVNKEVEGADQYGNFANKFGLDEAALTAGAELTVKSACNLGKATTGTTNLVFQNNASPESDIVAKITKVEIYFGDADADVK